MNYLEEQRNELEAIQEIYYNEIKVISDKPPISFSIKINQQDFDDDQEGSTIELLFELPPKYPDEEPSIEILDYENLEEHDVSRLLADLRLKAEESLGNVMVFMLVSDVVEWLMTQSEDEAEELEVEEEEANKKQLEIEANLTPVTEQTFLAWKAKFDAEMLKANLDTNQTRRMTGREMFENDETLAGSDLNFVEDLDTNEIEALLHHIEEEE